MRPSDWSTVSRPCVRPVFRCAAFSLAPALGSIASASGRPALFGNFAATTAESDFSPPCIIGVRLSPSQCGPCPWGHGRERRPPGFHARSVIACLGSLTTPSRLTGSPWRPQPCCLPGLPTRSALESPLSRLNTQPTTPLTNASPLTSRSVAHGTGPVRQATPSPYGTCIHYSLPAFPAHGQSDERSQASAHRRGSQEEFTAERAESAEKDWLRAARSMSPAFARGRLWAGLWPRPEGAILPSQRSLRLCGEFLRRVRSPETADRRRQPFPVRPQRRQFQDPMQGVSAVAPEAGVTRDFPAFTRLPCGLSRRGLLGSALTSR